MKHKHQRNKIQGNQPHSSHAHNTTGHNTTGHNTTSHNNSSHNTTSHSTRNHSSSGHRRHNSRSAVSAQVRRQKRLRKVLTVILLILLAVLGTVIFYKQKEQKTENARITSSKQENAKKQKAEKEKAKAAEQKAKAEEAAKKKAEEEKNSRLNKDVQTAENTATEQDHKTNGLSICMYHYVYDKNNPPKEQLNNNFIEVHDLEAELKYLTENNYYFPTWEEVRKYVKGELLLPKKSVVLTFDDGAYSFLNLGVPLFNKYKVPVTSFLIGNLEGKKKVKKYASEYMTFQSHSYNMHRGGGNIGHGGIFPVMNHDDAVADLQKSIRIGGNSDAFAYPYGDYNDSCIQAVKDAGFKCAVTTEYGRAKVGDDPLVLPRIRMLRGQSLDSFKKLVE